MVGEQVPEPKHSTSGEGSTKLEHSFLMGEWAKDKREVWDSVVEKYGGNKEAFEWGTWGFFDWATGKNWPTVSSMSKARAYGWHRHDDTYDNFVETFRAFENAGYLPPHPNRHVELVTQPKSNGH